MNSLSTQRVVDQMIDELAARRRTMVGRRAAYLALAKVILKPDDQHASRVSPEMPEGPRCDWGSAAAA